MFFSLVYVLFSREKLVWQQHEKTKEASLQIPFQESFFTSVLLRLQYCALRSVVIHSLCFWLSNYLSDGTFTSHVFNHQSCGLKSPRIFVTSVSATSFSNAFPLALVVSAMKAIAILPVSTVFDPERLRTSAPRNTSRRRNAKLTVKCGRCSARLHKANTTSANPDFMALEPRNGIVHVNSMSIRLSLTHWQNVPNSWHCYATKKVFL